MNEREGAEARVVAPGARLEKLAGGFEFTEGPTCDAEGNVFFTDQPNDRILKWSVEGKLSTFLQPAGRANGMYFDPGGHLIACADEKTALWSIAPDGTVTVLVGEYAGKLLNGPNDVWVRPDGALYFTDPFYDRSWWTHHTMPQDGQHVYFLSTDRRRLVRVAGDLEKPNGIIGTPDGKTLYVADIDAGRTYRYDSRAGRQPHRQDARRRARLGRHDAGQRGQSLPDGRRRPGAGPGGPAGRAHPGPRRALDVERQLRRQRQADALHHCEHGPVRGQDAREGSQHGEVTSEGGGRAGRSASRGSEPETGLCGGSEMKAITVEPRKPETARLEDIPEPDVREGSVLVEAIAVGVCGTDVEIVEGKYGWAPPGETRLVLGHESLGRVVDPGPRSSLKKGDLVVGIVRRPDPVPCPNCAVGEWDMCRNGEYTERGIKEIHGFMSERWRIEPEYAVKVDPSLGILGVLLEPTTVITKALEQVVAVGQRAFWEPRTLLVTGAGPIGLLAAAVASLGAVEVHVLDRVESGLKPDLVRALGATYHSGSVLDLGFEPDVIVECTGVGSVIADSIQKIGAGGVVCLTGVGGGGLSGYAVADVAAKAVLKNNVMVGSVNANKRHWYKASERLSRLDRKWLSRLITRREKPESFKQALERRPDDVKVVIQFSEV